MTGPEHYKKAEELIGYAEDADADATTEDVALMLQFAQAHATLAQAAATALAAGSKMNSVDFDEWDKAAAR